MIFFVSLRPSTLMNNARTYIARLLLALFCCYFSGISLFSHVHIVNGCTVVHSHFGGGSEHSHSDSQYAVIDILSLFQSEAAGDITCISKPLFHSSEICIDYSAGVTSNGAVSVQTLRGPPQC